MSNKSIPKVANGKCREYVRNMKEFTGNNLFARYTCATPGTTSEIFYVVYSYGSHYPLFIYHCSTKTWFENEDRYSVTTSKHRSQAHPLPLVPTKKASTQFMRRMLDVGLVLSVQEAA
jgi:hypothetical protein